MCRFQHFSLLWSCVSRQHSEGEECIPAQCGGDNLIGFSSNSQKVSFCFVKSVSLYVFTSTSMAVV